MPAHFNDLPDEIISKIAEGLSDYWDKPNLRTLRSVSKRLNNLVEPIVFETIRIRPYMFPTEQICEAITAEVTSGKTTVFSRATRKADIHLDSEAHTEDQMPWLEVVRFLTPTLINLRSVEWNYLPSNRYSSRFMDHFVSTLGSLPSLKELSIVFQSNDFRPNFSLEPISDLLSISIEWEGRVAPAPLLIQEISKLVSRSPDLESFAFATHPQYRGDNLPSFGDIFHSLVSLPPTLCLNFRQIKLFGVTVTAIDFMAHSRHFKSLQALEVLSNGSPAQSAINMAGICQSLEHERVYLKHFATESVYPPEIFQYLSSFSGLERLQFHPIHLDDGSTELVDRFFSLVLPLHRHTLKSIKFGTHIPTIWTKLNENHLEQIGRCTSLRDISCWVCCQTPRGAHTDELMKKWLQTATQLPQLRNCVFNPTVPSDGVLRGGFRTLDPDVSDAVNRVERYVRAIVDKFENEHELKFKLITFIKYYKRTECNAVL